MIKRIAIILLILVFVNNYKAQTIIAKSFVKNKNLILRFVPANNQIWNEVKEKGFKIERAELDSPDTSNAKNPEFKTLTINPLKPKEKNDTAWKRIIKTSDFGAFVYNGLYKIPTATDAKTKTASNAMWGMLMKQADLNIESAKLLGLYFKDENINENKFYLYKISVLEKSGDTKHKCLILVDTKKENYLPLIELRTALVSNRKVALAFKAKLYENYYSGYVIERSEDSVNYKPITKRPLIYITNEFEKNKEEITCNDSLPTNKTFYYYRLKGLSYFGESGPTSKAIKVKGKEPIGSYPFMDSVKLVNKETQIKVYFHFPKNANLSVVKNLFIFRSEESKGKAELITQNSLMINSTNFIDEKPRQTNYYTVRAITFDNDTVCSFEGFGMLPDREPPASPTEVKGKIDSIGVVRLNWKANTENDLQGYRVFRKNALNEELVEITKRILIKPEFTDTINIKTLTKFIYYALTAVDKVYNNSKYSADLKLKRPDIIAPVKPVFTQTFHNNRGIVLKWYNSTSDDVLKYELYRIENKTKEIIKLKEWLLKDTLSSYIDTTCIAGNTYQYKLMVYDDSNNKNEELSLFLVFETGIRKQIKDISNKVDLEKRLVELSWTYNEKDLYSFIIYKAKQGEDLRIYKTLKPTDSKLIDRSLDPGNIYVYRIKAVYNSGVESELSKEIKIEF